MKDKTDFYASVTDMDFAIDMLTLSVIPRCLLSSGSKSGPCGQSGIELLVSSYILQTNRQENNKELRTNFGGPTKLD